MGGAQNILCGKLFLKVSGRAGISDYSTSFFPKFLIC